MIVKLGSETPQLEKQVMGGHQIFGGSLFTSPECSRVCTFLLEGWMVCWKARGEKGETAGARSSIKNRLYLPKAGVYCIVALSWYGGGIVYMATSIALSGMHKKSGGKPNRHRQKKTRTKRNKKHAHGEKN